MKTTMENFTLVTDIILGAYYDTGPFKHMYFFTVLSLYILIVLSNFLLIVVICLNRTLHEPMYIFLCSLFVNELYGSTCVSMFILVQILKDVHIVSVTLCYLQVFQIYSYVSVEFTNLAVMSYDRYLAICFPLQYNTRMNFHKVTFLICLIWIPPIVAVGITTILTASLTLCGNVIEKVYCDNYSIIKLSCFDITVNNWYELVAASITVIIPLNVIFFTYLYILKVCFNGSKQTQQKALSTCTPHLCSVLNFGLGISFEVIQTRFDTSHLPIMMSTFLPFYLLICQPFFNPLMYGLNLSKIRNLCKKCLLNPNNKICMIEME